MIKFKDVSVREAAWVINAYIDEIKREERIALMDKWPELHDALEALATGHVPVRSSKVD